MTDDNPRMKLRFTKMHGAGNDFVVLDATREPLALDAQAMRRLGDRRFGVGADQILMVEKSNKPNVDFGYRIFNNSGDEVEQCGNGARCFVRYVHDKGLTDKTTIKVETMNTMLELRLQADGRVTVDMSAPDFEPDRVPFDASGLEPRRVSGFELWPLDGRERGGRGVVDGQSARGADGSTTSTARRSKASGPHVSRATPRFPRKVNAGFMQVSGGERIRMRVYERDVGETLACGTGACAAVVAGIRFGWLSTPGRCRNARRPVDDRMGGRRRQRVHDGACRDRFRRRDRT